MIYSSQNVKFRGHIDIEVGLDYHESYLLQRLKTISKFSYIPHLYLL